MEDAKNPVFLFSGTDTELLAQIINGSLDPVLFARKEMANRGFDEKGVWVGFAKAKEIHFNR